MSDTSQLADMIAKKLEEIKSLSRKRVSVQNRLDELKGEIDSTKEELNKIEEGIRSLKYEVTDCLSDKVLGLKLVGNE
jgi:peptidoglycan hydrolase CwlO-like protein